MLLENTCCSRPPQVIGCVSQLVTGACMELLGAARHVVTLRLLRLVLSLALGCFVWLSAVPARGDGLPPPPVVLPPAYDVTGTLTIVGNPVCGGLPCTETIAFSFDFGYQFFPAFPTYVAYFSNLLANGSGAVGSFTYSVAGPQGFGGENNFLPFLDSAGDGFQIYALSPVFGAPAPVAPSFASFGDLFSCETATCLTDFAPAAFQGQAPHVFGIFLSGPAVIKVKALPEPATLSLLVWGLLALGLVVASKTFGALES